MPVHLMTEEDRITVKDSELGLADGDPDTEYILRPLTRETYRRIAKPHTKKVPDRATRQMVDQTNWDAVGEDLLDFALVDWKGILLRGQPVPCERAHKLMLDGARTSALLEKAGLSQVRDTAAAEGAKVASFRQAG